MLFPPRSQEALAPAPDPGDAPVLDAERLDVYKVALAFQLLASSLAPPTQPALRNQLERASISIVLNIAEGGATSEGWRIQWESVPPGEEPEAP